MKQKIPVELSVKCCCNLAEYLAYLKNKSQIEAELQELSSQMGIGTNTTDNKNI